MQDWESKFARWASPPGAAEENRIENSEKAIRDALGKSDALKSRDVRVFTQGSYQNNTNVRNDSDVDVAIVCYDTFFPDYPEDTKDETFGNKGSDYQFSQFKNEVELALVDHFGASSVTRSNKAFDIKENSYRVEADVAAFFEHRRYNASGTYESGCELRPDNGNPFNVINWPKQHCENGRKKNNDTGRRYKSIVRILKSLKNEMADNGDQLAQEIPGFLIECLVWNSPKESFGRSSYTADLRACLANLCNDTRSEETCSEWGEVSELKYLFRPTQKWTRQNTNLFLNKVWNYVGYN